MSSLKQATDANAMVAELTSVIEIYSISFTHGNMKKQNWSAYVVHTYIFINIDGFQGSQTDSVKITRNSKN